MKCNWSGRHAGDCCDEEGTGSMGMRRNTIRVKISHCSLSWLPVFEGLAEVKYWKEAGQDLMEMTPVLRFE